MKKKILPIILLVICLCMYINLLGYKSNLYAQAVSSSAKRYVKVTGRRVVFEYALTHGVNDTAECAEQLASLLRGFQCHINLIPLNEVRERNLKTVTHKSAVDFCKKLSSLGLSATVRRTMGEDIEGACGQLRTKVIKGINE